MSANGASALIALQATTPGAKPGRLDASVANELNALWRSIFQRAHASETHDETRAKAVPPNRLAYALQDAGELAKDSTKDPGVKWTFSSPQRPRLDLLHAIDTNGGAELTTGFVPPVSLESPRCIAVQELQLPIASVPVTTVVSEDIERAAPATTRARPNNGAAQAPVEQEKAAEAVSVFMNGGAIMINVRDAVLSEDEALRCAFETARTLTGERGTLRGLMLNGRTIYRRAPPETAGASPTLLFAC